MITQCMGGKCGSREKCDHYHAPQIQGRNPVERLCGQKEEPEHQASNPLPVTARRILSEREAGREVDPYRIEWANDIIAFFDRGDKVAGARVFVGNEDSE